MASALKEHNTDICGVFFLLFFFPFFCCCCRKSIPKKVSARSFDIGICHYDGCQYEKIVYNNVLCKSLGGCVCENVADTTKYISVRWKAYYGILSLDESCFILSFYPNESKR